MTPGITDSRWPPQRPAQPTSAVAQYPSYLAPRVGEVKPTYSPLVSAVVAYAFSFVAQLLVAIPIGFLVVAHGIAVISRPHTDDDLTHAAFVAAMLTMAALTAVGVLASWLFLRLRDIRGAFLVAFVGQAVDLAVNAAGRLVDLPGHYVLGAVAAVGVMFAMARRRTKRA